MVRRWSEWGWAVAVFAGVIGGACSESGSGSAPQSEMPGRQVAVAAGCSSCHGSDFAGGIGPSWVGLAGSDVALDDGSTVVADADYLFESIRDPSAKRVAGFGVAMPSSDLTDDEISEIVDYITSLRPNGD